MSNLDRRIRRRFRARPGLSFPTVCPRGGRNRLAELFSDVGFNKGVEVGVRQGKFSKVLCEANPNLELCCVDPWVPFNKITQEKQDAYYQDACTLLAPYNAALIKKPSLEAVHLFEDRSFDFVYLDGAHEFDDIMRDIIEWNKKVKIGGILASHDHSTFPDVARAADAYVMAHNISPWYLIRERESTCFWVVEK